jgi:flagellar hook-basal body complex protein FliE
MSGAVAAIEAIRSQGVLPTALPSALPTSSASFADILQRGIATTNTKLLEAERKVTAFALDDSVPAHQVTFALEEARLSLELMIQVRNRMIDGYQQIMNMQV